MALTSQLYMQYGWLSSYCCTPYASGLIPTSSNTKRNGGLVIYRSLCATTFYQHAVWLELFFSFQVYPAQKCIASPLLAWRETYRLRHRDQHPCLCTRAIGYDLF